MNKTRRFSLDRCANILAALIIVLTPFHAFLTTWAGSIFGYYTAIRLWDELFLLVLATIVGVWVVRDRQLRVWVLGSVLMRVIFAYALLTVALGVVGYMRGEVTLKALGYGVIVNLRYLLFFVAVLITARRSYWLGAMWMRLLFVPAVLVALFALFQYTVLPHNFLTHFGYGPTTIAPTETINNNAAYIRVQSTLRGANPLGAYMVMILGVAASLWGLHKRRLWVGGIGLLAGEALLFSFSRSAWLGAALAVAVALWLQLKTRKAKLVSAAAAGGILLVAVGAFFVLRSDTALQNAIFHTDNHSTIAVSSNEAHASAVRGGLDDVIHEPLGRGPGTAGPASVYNGDHGSRIAENYFVQIAQEVGWAGVVLLLGIFGLLAAEFYQLRHESLLALGLLASLVGVTLVAMLSHVWVDDTLAYVWWGMAGIAYGTNLARVEDRMKAHVRHDKK